MRLPVSTRFFTWLHVPKTGGTWLHGLLTKMAPPSWDLKAGPPAHIQLYEVPIALEQWHGVPERVSFPRIATVRNPWEWYVSLYFFMDQHYANRTGGFAPPRPQWTVGLQKWADHYSKGNSIAGFRAALPTILDEMHIQKTFGIMRPQYEWLRLGSGELGVQAVRFENLRQGTLDAIASTGAPIPENLRQALLASGAINRSTHHHYSAYYTPQLRDLVAKYERWTIDTFNFRFEKR